MTPPHGTLAHGTSSLGAPSAHGDAFADAFGEAFTGSTALAPDVADAAPEPSSPSMGAQRAESTPIPLFPPATPAPRESDRAQGLGRSSGYGHPSGTSGIGGRHGARASGVDGASGADGPHALAPADDGAENHFDGRGNGRHRSGNGASPAALGYEHVREPLRAEVRGALGPFIDSLREVFERDRGIASQGNTTRCGICYLHFSITDLLYREEEGFYVCPGCAQALGSSPLFMVRRQQR